MPLTGAMPRWDISRSYTRMANFLSLMHTSLFHSTHLVSEPSSVHPRFALNGSKRNPQALNAGSSANKAYGVPHAYGVYNPIAPSQWPSSGLFFIPPGKTTSLPPKTRAALPSVPGPPEPVRQADTKATTRHTAFCRFLVSKRFSNKSRLIPAYHGFQPMIAYQIHCQCNSSGRAAWHFYEVNRLP